MPFGLFVTAKKVIKKKYPIATIKSEYHLFPEFHLYFGKEHLVFDNHSEALETALEWYAFLIGEEREVCVFGPPMAMSEPYLCILEKNKINYGRFIESLFTEAS